MIVFPDYDQRPPDDEPKRCRRRAIIRNHSTPIQCTIVGKHDVSIAHELRHRWGSSSRAMTERQLVGLFAIGGVTFDDLGEDQ